MLSIGASVTTNHSSQNPSGRRRTINQTMSAPNSSRPPMASATGGSSGDPYSGTWSKLRRCAGHTTAAR